MILHLFGSIFQQALPQFTWLDNYVWLGHLRNVLAVDGYLPVDAMWPRLPGIGA
jgi:hypothetical protein